MTTEKNAAGAVLVLGGYGVGGASIVDSLLDDGKQPVITASRRKAPDHILDGRVAPPHIEVDLLDADASATAFASLSNVTDVIHAAFIERADASDAVTANLAILANALNALDKAGAKLNRVVLLTGAKAYGPHLGPYKTPARESDPRISAPMFYYDQEDFLAKWCADRGITWSVLRPDGILGPGLGSPMNLLQGIAVYAAVSKELGLPLSWPGSDGAYNALHELTDAGLLGASALWAMRAPGATNDIFNVINGDQFRWRHVWPVIAEFFGMEVGEPKPMSLTTEMADKGPVWEKMIASHGLRPTPWTDIAAWPFVDAIFGIGYDMVQSTIKIRKAGFADCVDTHESFKTQLGRLRAYKLIP